jgi:hypothetical protein
MDKKNGTSEGTTNTHDDSINNSSTAAQVRRLLAELRKRSVTSFSARHELNCYHPNARILDLRNAGYKIHTGWQAVTDECGREHRVGVWTLLEEPEGVEQ